MSNSSPKWESCKLGEVLKFSNGRSSPERFKDAPIPVFGSNGIIGHAYFANSPADTIVIGRVGSYCGSVYFSSGGCWVTDNAIKATALNQTDPRYIFYLLRNLELNRWREGSGQPLLNQTILKGIEIALPNRTEQKAISDFIYSLDYKIELNRQTNKTLESMAQALFKSWFVDFDPVIDNALTAGNEIPEPLTAKAAARRALQEQRADKANQPHTLPNHIRQLFPSRFQFTEELGWIPEGWSMHSLSEVTNIVYGKNLPTKNLKASGYPVFGGNGVIGYHHSYLYQEPHVLIACRGAASGKVMLSLPNSFVTNNSLIIEHQDLSAYYLYHALLNQDLTSFTSGSAQPQMTIANINPAEVLLSNKKAMDEFHLVVNRLYKKRLFGIKQIENLSELRDTLLPKLLSGELRIPEAKREVDEALA